MLAWALICVLLHATHPMAFGSANFSSLHNDCNSTQFLRLLTKCVSPPKPINMELRRSSTSPWDYVPYINPDVAYGDGRLLQAQCKDSSCRGNFGRQYLSKPINLTIPVVFRRPIDGTRPTDGAQYLLKLGRISITVGCTCVLAR